MKRIVSSQFWNTAIFAVEVVSRINKLHYPGEFRINTPYMKKRRDCKTMEINSNVIIQNLTPKTKKRQALWGLDFEGKKGKIVEVLINSRGEKQGYRVRFPMIKIVAKEDGGMGERENFDYPFYNSEVALLEEKEELVFPILGDNGERKRRTQEGVKATIRAVKRLRQEGLKINELADRFNVSRQTIHQWLKK